MSLNNYRYPGSGNVAELRRHYDEVVTGVLSHLSRRRPCHFLLVPQLYGHVHTDVPYLEKIGRRLPDPTSWELVDPDLDADMQRRLFAMCDMHIASRYHPAIFGNTVFVPGICIYYEHKALGFMQQLGLERFAFDILALDERRLEEAMDEILEHREGLVQYLRQRVPEVQANARRTTTLAVSLLERVKSVSPPPKDD